ncbi:hypothetical protein [Hyphococcus sp. DH-69]|uniref:hypothetical protein n=1 Tax=Hyphococcus formosus TaxID=3143534 RepID=UPI00398B6506
MAADKLAKELSLTGQKKHITRNTITLLINCTHQQKFYKDQYIKFGKAENYFRELKTSGNLNTIGISYTFIDLINKAIENDLIEEKIGFHDRNWSGRITRIKPTEKLISEYIDAYDLHNAKTERKLEPLVLRDRNKTSKSFNTTSQVKRYQDIVRRYNNFIGKQSLALSGSNTTQNSNVIFDDYHVYRVFNNSSLTHGGRFYGAWWINLQSELRPHITINGATTIELDFQAQHVYLMYGLEGISYLEKKEDPYELDGYHRNTVKKAILTAINTTNMTGAFRACLKELKDKYGSAVRSMDYFTYVSPVDTKAGYEGLIYAFLAKHPPLEKHLHTNIGNTLMYLDSQICSHILDHMTERELPVLPIHDSFILRKDDQNELIIAATAAYQKVCPKGIAPLL